MNVVRFSVYLLFFSVAALAISGCGDDCAQSDFIGSYTGTSECSDPSVTLDSDSFTITAGSSTNQITISDGAGFSATATINGCDFSVEGLPSGSSLSGDIDGNVLSFTQSVDDNGVNLTCTFTGSK